MVRQEISIDSITTSSTGRSMAPVLVVAMASMTFCESASATLPKMVCRLFRCGVGRR